MASLTFNDQQQMWINVVDVGVDTCHEDNIFVFLDQIFVCEIVPPCGRNHSKERRRSATTLGIERSPRYEQRWVWK